MENKKGDKQLLLVSLGIYRGRRPMCCSGKHNSIITVLLCAADVCVIRHQLSKTGLRMHKYAVVLLIPDHLDQHVRLWTYQGQEKYCVCL